MHFRPLALGALFSSLFVLHAAAELPFTQVPAEFAGQLSPGKSPLVFNDGRKVTSADDWNKRRTEILADWHAIMGAWPKLLETPKIEILETTTRDGGIAQRKVLEGCVEQARLHGLLRALAGAFTTNPR